MQRYTRIYFCLLLFCSAGLFAGSKPAQKAGPSPLVIGQVHHLHSSHLGEDRTLNIYLPHGYEQNSRKYPVIYLLDGSAHEDFLHAAGLVQFLSLYRMMPESIVVGIANVDRRRDFTYPSTVKSDKKEVPTGGGSANFKRFLKDELKPYVQARLRTKGKNTIIGQSLGGLLATEILLTEPEMFDNYILISPSLWWDGRKLAGGAGEFLKAHPKLKKKVFIGLGSEGRAMQECIDTLVAGFKQHAGKKLKWNYESFPKETHATLLHRGLYRALVVLHKKR